MASLFRDRAIDHHHDAVGRRIVDKRCAITIVVRVAIRCSRASCTRRSESVSSAEVASSRIKIGAFLSSARAMARRWRCPPDKLHTHLADHRIVAVGHRHDKFMRVRRLRRRDHGLYVAIQRSP